MVLGQLFLCGIASLGAGIFSVISCVNVHCILACYSLQNGLKAIAEQNIMIAGMKEKANLFGPWIDIASLYFLKLNSTAVSLQFRHAH